MKHQFVIPYNLPSQNVTSRRHWRANHREVAQVAQMARLACWQACAAKGPRTLHIISYRRQRIADHSNMVGGAKYLVDGLVKAGALADDNDRMARITYEQHVLSEMPADLARKYGRRPVTIIELSDVSPVE